MRDGKGKESEPEGGRAEHNEDKTGVPRDSYARQSRKQVFLKEIHPE